MAQRTTIKSGSARPGEVQEGRTVLERGQNQKGVLFKKDFQNLFSSFENTTIHPHSGKI